MVCGREIHPSQGSDLAFVQKDRMFLVQFHALVEVHFQGRALSCVRFCTSIPCQQLEPFWIYMLDAAALMGLPGLNFVTGEKAKSLFTRLNGKV